jgi:glutathione peroxidase
MIMHKPYFLILSAFLLTGFTIPGIYEYSFNSIEGNDIYLNNYRNKKIVISTLPAVQTTENNNYLLRLDSLSRANPAIIMIGIPSYEDGYTQQNAAALKNWYRSKLGNQFIIGRGMHTRKISSGQHSIFKWLTKKEWNQHFDNDVEGAGEQFFINENGELYGVLDPEVRWSNIIFNRLVQ